MEMFLIETSSTSQSVMSDTHPYKSVPASNRTEGTFEEVLAIRVFTIPIGLPITYGDLYTGATQCRVNRQIILSFSQIPGLHHRSSNAIYNDVSLFGMGYMTQGPLPAKPNNEHKINNIWT